MGAFRVLCFVSVFALTLCSEPTISADINNHADVNDSSESTNGSFIAFDVVGDRIFGGFETNIENIPWQVSLQRKSHHVCGGAIISPKWILTAAHCTTRSQATGFTVRAGSANEHEGGIVVRIRRFFQHLQYVRRTLDYDFTLAQLASSLTFSDQIKAIILPNERDRVEDDTQCLVSGWGSTEDPDESPEYLRAVYLPITNQNYCQRKWNGAITSRMICAGFRRGGKDTCFGDSGGPMSCPINGTNKLIGIVSFGEDCGKPNIPGVYARTSSVRQWIALLTGV